MSASVNYISPLDAPPAKKTRNVVILGGTGSIGASALKVIREHPGKFKVLGLSAATSASLLADLAVEFRPPYLAVISDRAAKQLRERLPRGYNPEVLVGETGYVELASLNQADLVLSAVVGVAGLAPTLAAAKKGKIIALANKESLVAAGHLIRKACHDSGAVILPVDSEHNALFQGMTGHDHAEVEKLILTASGGPFRNKDRAFLKTVTPEMALNHPNWSMGAKITVDSATLMNKGLEIIEAVHLYGVSQEDVQVLVHPQSIVHSLVRYCDGSVLAHLGVPDMTIPISYCLAFPKRLPLALQPLDLVNIGTLTFEAPRPDVFACLRLARQCLEAEQSLPVVLNAANEAAVEAFLAGELEFWRIPEIIEQAMSGHDARNMDSLEDILDVDRQARMTAKRLIRG